MNDRDIPSQGSRNGPKTFDIFEMKVFKLWKEIDSSSNNNNHNKQLR